MSTITNTHRRLPADRFGTDHLPTHTVSSSEYNIQYCNDNIELLPISQGPHQTTDNDNNITLCKTAAYTTTTAFVLYFKSKMYTLRNYS